jgi:thiamine biosynthesis protein ThiI
MNQKIIVRFSELTTKGKNRMEFVNKLKNNLCFFLGKEILKEVTIKKEFDKFLIDTPKKHLEKVYDGLNNLMGISSYTLIKEFENYEDFEVEVIKFAKTLKGTFKVNPKIRQKGIVTSSDLFKRQVAKSILDNTDLTVDIKTPDNSIVVEAYAKVIMLHLDSHPMPDSLPVGTNGKALSLLSGGLDSPVASYMIMKRGMDLDYITFLTPPHTTKKAEEKIIKIAKELSKFSGRIQRLYVVDFTSILNELGHANDKRYSIVLMRRSFIRIANKIAGNYNALVTGDSLGQVASQTIDGLTSTTDATTKIILRPLIAVSKNDTIKIARDIGTYDISILPSEDTCSLFVPDKPVTKPKLEVSRKLEDDLMILNELEDKVIKENIKMIKLGDA